MHRSRIATFVAAIVLATIARASLAYLLFGGERVATA